VICHPHAAIWPEHTGLARVADADVELRHFRTHQDEDIRTTAFYWLGKMASKQDQVDLFLMGLEDSSPHVVHATLQAIEGVRDQRLASAYERVRSRFKTDEHYILTNLAHRMKEMRSGILDHLLTQFKR
jgi:hypothetical protein